MTGAPVTDLSSYLLSYPSTNLPQSKERTNEFQQLLDGVGEEPNKEIVTKFEAGGKTKSEETHDMSAFEQSERPNKVSEQVTGTEDEDFNQLKDLSEEELEEISETLQSAIQAIVTRVSEEFEISPEELQDVMKQIGMTETDLLDATQMKELAVAISADGDAMKLVTDEDFYASVKETENFVSEVVTQLSDALNVPKEELQAISRQSGSEQTTESQDGVQVLVTKEELSQSEKSQAGEQSILTDETETETAQTKGMTDIVNKNGGEATQNEDESQENHRNTDSKQTYQTQTMVITEQVGVNAEGTISEVRTQSAETEAIFRQITDYIKVHVKPGVSSVEMQLTPENLGTLHIQLVAKDGKISAQFTAENETVKAALEGQMIQLRENFEQQGFKVESVEVSVRERGFESGGEQSNAEKEKESPGVRKTGGRRINLLEDPDLSELTQEEQLEADIMVANGNTVDYIV